MGVRKGNRPFRKTLKVRGLDPRVIIEWRNVVIQVVNRDEEDMRFSNDGESDEQEEGDDWKERAHGDMRERNV